MRGLRALLFCALLLLAPRAAWAHGRSTSWSTWAETAGGLEVQVRLSRLDLSAVPRLAAFAAETRAGDEGALSEYLVTHLRVETAGGRCAVDAASYAVLDPRAAGEGFLLRAWRVRCEGSGPRRIVSDLLFPEAPSHVHFATLVREGTAVAEHVLTQEAPSWDPGGQGRAAEPEGIFAFIALGVRHVASGADHLVFVLALLVAARSLRTLAAVVTGFTLGHSVTLAAAVLGQVRPEPAAVEALVGASIAVVAVENVWLVGRDPWLPRALSIALGAAAVACLFGGAVPALALSGVALFVASYFGLLARSEQPERLRWVVAALFGTVHGLAFSGVLAEMKLPPARLLSSLLGFNAGVELGQLAVVALAWPLWRLLGRTRAAPWALSTVSALALVAGVYWFVDRAFGG